MTDVYTGSRPGRPTALLILGGLALAGTLGLALLQVRGKTALGPEQQVLPDTPLYARPPSGWLADRNEPGSFVLPVQRSVQGRQVWEADRRIHFGHEQLPYYISPESWLAANNYADFDPTPARIGRFDALQVRPVIWRRWGRGPNDKVERRFLLRVASLPGGHLLTAVYVPMTDLTIADISLFDKICESVRFAEPALAISPEDALKHAGVEWPLDAKHTLALPALPEVPGVLVGGVDAGIPAWSLGIYRTWLAADRRPDELLNDFAAIAWTRWYFASDHLEVRQWRRADGAQVAALRHPNPARKRHPVSAVWVVAQSPSAALIIYAYAEAPHLPAAEQAAERIIDQIKIAPLAAIPDPAIAQDQGAEFVKALTRKGAVPWWGREQVQLEYHGTTAYGREALVAERSAVRRDPRLGYQGSLRRHIQNRKWEERTYWTLGPGALGYTTESEAYLADDLRVTVNDRRAPGADTVTRAITLNEIEQQSFEFRPGSYFLAPPVESIVEAQVAHSEDAQWIVEVATVLGRGTHMRLLRALPPDGQGHVRTLLQDDYWPAGVILAFDDNNDLLYQYTGTSRYERVE
ncbi:MAG: hypothetical protein ABIG44_00795 [Planctomycetota bacterium]